MERTFKLQSAMEYLMTYGWAILIIAVVAVALFALGVFNGSGGTSCTPSSGTYTCSNVVFSHATGNTVVTVSQVTGTAWATANVYFVPTGTTTTSGIPTTISGDPTNTGVVTGGLYSGVQATATVPTASTTTSAGAKVSGTFWIVYQLTSGGTAYYAQIATANLQAV